MKKILIFILTIYIPTTALASAGDLPPAQSQVVKLTDSGVVPQNLTMKLQDSIVFVLNASTSSLMTLEMDFGGKTTHCSSSNMSVVQNTSIKSKRPIGPNDFASLCFHDKGSYPYKISGLSGKVFQGTVTIE